MKLFENLKIPEFDNLENKKNYGIFFNLKN